MKTQIYYSVSQSISISVSISVNQYQQISVSISNQKLSKLSILFSYAFSGHIRTFKIQNATYIQFLHQFSLHFLQCQKLKKNFLLYNFIKKMKLNFHSKLLQSIIFHYLFINTSLNQSKKRVRFAKVNIEIRKFETFSTFYNHFSISCLLLLFLLTILTFVRLFIICSFFTSLFDSAFQPKATTTSSFCRFCYCLVSNLFGQIIFEFH